MAALTVVGFASGSPLSQMAMARIARGHRLVAIVGPRPGGGIRQALRRILGRATNPLAELGVPLIGIEDVARYRPDVIAVASFQQIIAAATMAEARIGALNVHMSALPRHRGTDPVFWTYWDNEPDAAVTIHWMDARIDAGDIAAQQFHPFARGLASRELYMQLAAIGVELLADVLNRVASGQMPRQPQDETRASYQSAADIARARVPFAQWPAERVWHVLRGLGDQWSGLIAGADGEPLAHGRAMQYRVTGETKPGHIDVLEAAYELHCGDGIVTVERHAH